MFLMRFFVRLLQLLVMLVMYVRLLPSRNISDDISFRYALFSCRCRFGFFGMESNERTGSSQIRTEIINQQIG